MPDFSFDDDGGAIVGQLDDEDNKAMPAIIEVASDGKGGAKPPGRQLQDFIPGPHKLKLIQYHKEKRGEVVEQSRPHRRGVIVQHDATFIPEKEANKRRALRHERIVTLAKKFYNEKKSAIIEYRKSMDMTKRATKVEKLDPTKPLKRALKIVKLGNPMTKSDAMDRAREIIEKELSYRDS